MLSLRPAGAERPPPPPEPDALELLEVIPAWLRVPLEPQRLGFDEHYPAAQTLDRELGPLAGLEARCRYLQARLAAEFLARKSWGPLAYSRLRDYSSERLGVAARTLEEDARVVRALEHLPLLHAAFLSRKVSWTHLRLLTTIASTQDEAAWLDLACTMTTRQLEASVKEASRRKEEATRAESGGETPSRGGRDDPGDDVAASGGGGASSDVAAPRGARGDPSDVAAPRGGGDAGGDAASGCANAGDEDDDADSMVDWATPCTREGRRTWRAGCEVASRMAGGPLPSWQATELMAAEASSGAAAPAEPSSHWAPGSHHRRGQRRRLSSERYIEAFRCEYGSAEGFPYVEALRLGPDLPPRLESLLVGIADADAFELDRRLRLLRRAMQRIDWQLGILLRILVDRRLHQQLGFATFRLYVEGRLGIGTRKAWALVRLDRFSQRRSIALRDAYRCGDISWLAATTLLPIITEKYERAWIDRAGEVTLRRLAAEVSWALDRRDDPRGEECQAPPPLELNVTADSLRRVDPERVHLRAQAAAATSLPDWAGDVDPVYCGYAPGARIAFPAPADAIVFIEETIERFRAPGEPRWKGFERMVAHALLSWTSQPRHRDPVFERDGWTCTVPGCSSRRNLHDHHVVFRSQGGGNARDNRTSVCAAHHLHAVHTGRIRASGRAPDAITWELGCRPGKPPLLRTLGDRYLDGHTS